MKTESRFQDRICGWTTATKIASPPTHAKSSASSAARAAFPYNEEASRRPGDTSCSRHKPSSPTKPSDATIPRGVSTVASVRGNQLSYFSRALPSAPIR